ncbi:GntR family transcriptional regulator [Nonomuraea sp. PA05]|uniref:GntR family transcriptional regulator n=1 Tax=Nonomuraea sp. PA05 TaxID=2604466 RepID=UPI0011D50CCB|nr:GntR family transcriptional regulator [Nonomuraea sp. PA05]TYB50215.1 GntR family transcriptional regulator [Nonomuraea sp. PA05]
MALEDRRDRINLDGPRLVWQQVADDIEADITSGRLRPGAKLPNEREMAEVQYGVARVTVRRAVKELADRGLLVVVHGRGTFVAERPASGGDGGGEG